MRATSKIALRNALIFALTHNNPIYIDIYRFIFLLLTKKFPMFLSRLNEFSGFCKKIVPAFESF